MATRAYLQTEETRTLNIRFGHQLGDWSRGLLEERLKPGLPCSAAGLPKRFASKAHVELADLGVEIRRQPVGALHLVISDEQASVGLRHHVRPRLAA